MSDDEIKSCAAPEEPAGASVPIISTSIQSISTDRSENEPQPQPDSVEAELLHWLQTEYRTEILPGILANGPDKKELSDRAQTIISRYTDRIGRGARRSGPARNRKPRGPTYNTVDIGIAYTNFVNKYGQDRGAVTALAREFGCDHSTISHHLALAELREPRRKSPRS